MGVHERRVEGLRVERSAPPAQLIVFLLCRIGEHRQVMLVAPGTADVLGRTGVGDVVAHGELQAL